MKISEALIRELVRKLEEDTPIIEVGYQKGCIVPIKADVWEKLEVETKSIERKLLYNIKNMRYDTYLTALVDTISNNLPILIDKIDNICCPIGEICSDGRRYFLFIGRNGEYYLVSETILKICSIYHRISIPKNHVIAVDLSFTYFKDDKRDLNIDFDLYYQYLPRIDEALTSFTRLIHLAKQFNTCPMTILSKLDKIIKKYDYIIDREFRGVLTQLSRFPNLSELVLIPNNRVSRIFKLAVEGYLPERVLIYDFPLPNCGLLVFSRGEKMVILPCRSTDIVKKATVFSIFFLSSELKHVFMFNKYLPSEDEVEKFFHRLCTWYRELPGQVEKVKKLLNNDHIFTIMLSINGDKNLHEIAIDSVEGCTYVTYTVDEWDDDDDIRRRLAYWVYDLDREYISIMLC